MTLHIDENGYLRQTRDTPLLDWRLLGQSIFAAVAAFVLAVIVAM